MEVLGELEISSTVAHLESRLDSLEIDIARVAGAREEDSRRTTGEMAVMKARVEDALSAVTGTAQDLRDAWLALDRRIGELVQTRFTDLDRTVERTRGELAAGIEGARLAAAEAEARLRGEIEGLSANDLARVGRVADLVSAVQSKLEGLAASVEGQIAEALAGARFDGDQAAEQLRKELAQTREDLALREQSLVDRLRSLAAVDEGLHTKVAAVEARRAGERAATDVSTQGVSDRVEALETRLRDALDALAQDRRLDALAGQVAEVRDGVLKVAERIGGAAFLTRRLADLEVRVAELAARVGRSAGEPG
jgi:hypothetical protein